MLCDFIYVGNGISRCSRAGCGQIVRSAFPAECFARCRLSITAPPCQYLRQPIERDGITVKVKCGCNGKEHEQPHTAHECKLYHRCLPTLVPADLAAWKERLPESRIYKLCHGCDRGANREN